MKKALFRNQPEFHRRFFPVSGLDKFFALKKEVTIGGKPLLIESGKTLFTPVDIQSVFGRPGPIEIEIGCGKGGFMLEYCTRFPDLAFLGIDKEFSIARYAARRLTKRPHLPSARILWGNAYFFFRDYLPDNIVKAFHMYFPDPWPKKRHRKRRLLTASFLKEICRTGLPGSRFHWRTDYLEYHESAMAAFKENGHIKVIDANADPVGNILTNFEIKYRREGRKIYRTVLSLNKPS